MSGLCSLVGKSEPTGEQSLACDGNHVQSSFFLFDAVDVIEAHLYWVPSI